MNRTTTLVLDALAAYRLTRLVTADTITEPVRRWLVEDAYHAVERQMPVVQDGATVEERVAADDEEPPKLATLLTCRWCAGMWVAAGVVAARIVAPRLWQPASEVLAVSAGAALLAAIEDD